MWQALRSQEEDTGFASRRTPRGQEEDTRFARRAEDSRRTPRDKEDKGGHTVNGGQEGDNRRTTPGHDQTTPTANSKLHGEKTQ